MSGTKTKRGLNGVRLTTSNSRSKKSRKASAFSAIALEWLKRRTPDLKRSSLAKYRNIVERYLAPQFRDRPIQSLTRSEISEYGETLLDIGGNRRKGLAPKTVNGILSVLNCVLEYAREEKGLPAIESVKTKIRVIPSSERRTLTSAERRRLTLRLEENLTPCNLGVLLTLHCGLRIGEICALRWSDVSLENGWINIVRSMQRAPRLSDDGGKKTEIIETTPKSARSVRRVPLSSPIAAILRRRRASDDAYLLTGDPSRFMEPRVLQYRFKTILRGADIPDLNFHSLRHSFATLWIENGSDVKSLSEILGHANVETTMNLYVHPSMEHKKKNMEYLSKRMTTDVKPRAKAF